MSKEKREKRAAAWAQAQEFRERAKKNEDMSAEDQAAWARALDDVDRLKMEIDLEERSDALDGRFGEIDEQTTPVDARGQKVERGEYDQAFGRFLRYGVGSLEPAERQLLASNFQADASRAQGTTTGAAGGYTVPQGFWAKVTETMKFYGGAQAAGIEVLNTDSGNTIPWPTNDDTSNVGALLSENTQVSEQDLTFGQKSLAAYTYTSKLVRVSLQLIQDSGVDAEGFTARKLGERLGRIYNQHATTGTGSSQPQGVITGATTGKTTAGGTAIIYNEIVDLIHSVDVAYRNGPGGAAFMMHDLVLAYVRKIRDDSGGSGLGRPIWEPSVQVGVPDSLLGYRVVINNDMASTVATTNKTMAFGNFGAAYVWRQVSGGQLLRLEERYADYLQVGFLAFGRADGVTQDSSAVKLLVQA